MLRTGFLCFALVTIAYTAASLVTSYTGNYSKSASQAEKRQYGTCDEECSNGAISRALQIGVCPVGYECLSNGCGHSCQKVIDEPIIGICVEMCEAGCPTGYECRSNGCGHTCQPILP